MDAAYLGVDGTGYQFRVRAVDAAGNASAWSQDSTTVYNVTKYYGFAGRPVAMRQCSGATCAASMFLGGDHLGSVSLVTDVQGAVVSQARFTPTVSRGGRLADADGLWLHRQRSEKGLG
jgi:hypothetical protein